MNSNKKRDNRIVLAIIAVSMLFIAAAFITVVTITGSVTTQSTPFISAVLALFGVMVPAIAAMLRSVESREMTRELDRKVNGHLSRLTEAAINAGVKPEDLPPPPPGVNVPMEDK